jgi:hypothetical protein
MVKLDPGAHHPKQTLVTETPGAQGVDPALLGASFGTSGFRRRAGLLCSPNRFARRDRIGD